MSMNYDHLAADYARHRRTHPEVLKRLLEDGRLAPASRILEVGCGTGNYLAALEEAAGCECWGLDPSMEMLDKARARLSRGRVQEGRAEAISFGGELFDLVFSVDVIHHVEDRQAHYREAFRILKPGGLLCTVTDSEDIIRHREPLATHFPETVAVELERYPRIQDLRAMMVSAGFTAIREETVAFRHVLTDIQRYRDKAFSSLHLIGQAAFERGIGRLEADLREKGSVPWWSRYLLLWGTRP